MAFKKNYDFFMKIKETGLLFYNTRIGLMTYFFVSYFFMNFPLLYRFIKGKSLFPGLSYFVLSDFTPSYSALGHKAYSFFQALVHIFPNKTYALLFFQLLITLLILLIILELIKFFKIPKYFLILFAINPIILNYSLILSTTLVSLLFFLLFLYPLILIVFNLPKISLFLTKHNINVHSFLIIVIFVLFYPLIFSFALNPLLMILFIIILSLLLRYSKEYAFMFQFFMIGAIFLFFILDFRYFALQNYSQAASLSFDIFKNMFHYYLIYIQRYVTKDMLNLLSVRGFVYHYDSVTFSNLVSKLKLYFPSLFSLTLPHSIKIEFGSIVVRLYNIIAYLMELYKFFIVTPGLIYLIILLIGLFSSKYVIRFLLLFFLILLFSLLDPHFWLLFGVFTMFLFIKGFLKIKKWELAREFVIIVMVFMFLYNYLMFLSYFNSLSPGSLVYFEQIKHDHNVRVLDYDPSVFSMIDVSFMFVNHSFFKVNNVNDFYERMSDYVAFLSLGYGQSYNLFLTHVNAKYLIVPFSNDATNSVEMIKDYFWRNNADLLFNYLDKNAQILYTSSIYPFINFSNQ